MKKLRYQCNKKSFAKLLFAAAVLLLSFFSLPGVTGQTPIKQDIPPTTLSVNPRASATGRIYYGRAVWQLHHLSLAAVFFPASNVNLSRAHSQQVKRFITILSKPDKYRRRAGVYYQVKTIPPNSGDKPAAL